jgi:hypothetical protein
VEAVYNGVGLPGRVSATTVGTTNYTNVASTAYVEADSAGRIGLWTTCITDGSDPIFKDGMVFIHRLY